MTNKTNEKKLIEQLLASKCEVVKLGVDVHARDLMVGVQLDGALPQRGRNMSREQLLQLPAEQFLPKYEALIEEYFRQLSEGRVGDLDLHGNRHT